MRAKELIYLISTSITADDIGNQIETPTERLVFAEELAVFSNEFYNAAASGLRAEKMLEIYNGEYQGEARLKYQDKLYRIIRTSLGKTPEKTRLTCERVVADG